jgi:hypothetical protein
VYNKCMSLIRLKHFVTIEAKPLLSEGLHPSRNLFIL